MDASLKFRDAAAVLTSTVSFLPVTGSTRFRVVGWLTSSSVCLVMAPKPGAVALTVYVAGDSCSKIYSPPLPTVTLCVCRVAVLVSVTVAVGTSAPVGSVTAPRTEVVPFCAQLQRLNMNTKNAASDVRSDVRMQWSPSK